MEKKNKFVKGKASCLVKTLYIIAAVLMAICAYMIVVNILYISNYASSYGVAVSSMMVDAIKSVRQHNDFFKNITGLQPENL